MSPNCPFDDAVNDYVESLSEDRRRALLESSLMDRHEQDWQWYQEVIERYALRDRSSPVARDINERVDPDPLGIQNVIWAGIGSIEPLHEAMTLLNAAKERLKVMANTRKDDDRRRLD